MSTSTTPARVKARKPHRCFLCSVPIERGTIHDRWTWFGDGRPSEMRAHDACDEYARAKLEGWVNGDGVDPGAVESDLWDVLVAQDEEFRHTIGETSAAKVLADFPGLAAQVARVRAEAAK